jgi:hypothetical protein
MKYRSPNQRHQRFTIDCIFTQSSCRLPPFFAAIAFSACFSISVGAQPNLQWQMYSGVSWAIWKGKEDPNEDINRYKAGAAVGVGLVMALKEGLGLELMAAYENKGRSLRPPAQLNARSNCHYLTLAVSLEKAPFRKYDQFSLGLGGYGGYLLQQQTVISDVPNQPFSFTDGFHRYDLGPLATARWDFLSYGKLDFSLQARAALGLVNIHKSLAFFPPDTVLRNRSLVLALGGRLSK